MTKTFGDYLVLLLSILGSFASIFAYGHYFASALNNQGWVGVLFLGIIALFFCCYNFYLICRYRRKVKYADAYSNINIGFSYLHRMNRAKTYTTEDIIQDLSKLCDSLADAFMGIYNKHIGVCIKFIVHDNNRPLAQTLVRDSYSKICQRKTGSNDTTKHWLDGNSDFEFIYTHFGQDTTEASFFQESHLPVCKDYKNTRLSSSWMPKGNFWIFENIVRRKTWPLKYRSTLVVPIIPLQADEQSQDKIRGFLCIDCPKEGYFKNHTDVDILKGVSDGLYNHIDVLYHLNADNK